MCVCEELLDREYAATVTVQRFARIWLARRRVAGMRKQQTMLQRGVAARAWQDLVLRPVFSAVQRHTDTKKEANERVAMAGAERESVAARQYLKLQVVLQAMDTQCMAIGTLIGLTGCDDPHPEARYHWFDPTGLLTADFPSTVHKLRRKLPHSAFVSPYHRLRSRQALRQAQRKRRLVERLKEKTVVRLTENLPAYGRPEVLVKVVDADVNEYVARADGGPRHRRRSSVAGPEHMYSRVVHIRPQLQRKLVLERRNSFDELARVDKAASEEDQRLAEVLDAEATTEAIQASLSLARKVMLPAQLAGNHLAVSGHEPRSSVGRSLQVSNFPELMAPYAPKQPGAEYRGILELLVDRDILLDRQVLDRGLVSEAAGRSRSQVLREAFRQQERTVMVGDEDEEMGGLAAGHHTGIGVQRGRKLARDSGRRGRRRQSLGAPERAGACVALWRAHTLAMASLRANPKPAPEGNWLTTYRSGARSASPWKRVAKRTRHGGDHPFQIARFERHEWEEESRMIEMVAQENRVSLEDPDVVAARRAAEAEAARVAAENEKEAQEARSIAEAENQDKLEAKAQATRAADVEGQAQEGQQAVEAGEKPAGSDPSKAGAVEGAAAAAWMSAVDGDGNTYFYNETGETVWELPEGAQLVEGEDYEYSYEEYGDSGGDQWEEAYDEQGYRYWYNQATGESYYDEEAAPGSGAEEAGAWG